MDKALEIAKEIEEIALKHNVSVNRLIEEYKKAQSLATKQGKEHNKTINAILTDNVEIDNGEIFDIETGATIRRLDDEGIANINRFYQCSNRRIK